MPGRESAARPLSLAMAPLREQPQVGGHVVAVRNLAPGLKDDALARILRRFGAQEVHRESPGSCMAHFPSAASARAARNQMHRIRILGHVISLEYLQPIRVKRVTEHLDALIQSASAARLAAPSAERGCATPVQEDGSAQRLVGVHAKTEPLAAEIGLPYDPIPHLRYSYPAPTGATIVNMANALIGNPRLYEQVLHLMNKMNLPPPFGPTVHVPNFWDHAFAAMPADGTPSQGQQDGADAPQRPVPSEHEAACVSERAPGRVAHPGGSASSAPGAVPQGEGHGVQRGEREAANMEQAEEDDASLGSDEAPAEQRLARAGVIKVDRSSIPKAPLVVKKRAPVLAVELRPRKKREAVAAPEASENIAMPAANSADQHPTVAAGSGKDRAGAPEAAGGALSPPAESSAERGLPQALPAVAPTAEAATPLEPGGMHEAAAAPEPRAAVLQRWTLEDVEKARLSADELAQVPAYKKYTKGNPSNVLYVKNVAKGVTEELLLAVVGALFPANEAYTEDVSARVLQEGRMKGQAFVTFKTVDTCQAALEMLLGVVVQGKPLIPSFGRGARKDPE